MRRPLLLTCVLATLACTSEETTEDEGPEPAACASDAECTDASLPLCDVAAGLCAALPAGHQIGWRDGSPSSVAFVPVYAPTRPLEATDLAFHPQRPNELWVLHRELESAEPCDSNSQTGCGALEGTIVVVFDPGTAEAMPQEYKDPNAWHFMRRPPALAFGDNGYFATVGEHRTGNFLDDPVDYIGPSLWSGDLPGIVPGCEASPTGCYTIQPPGKNGSHIDMLHASPWAMGIAHEQASAYWVFNGAVGALDRYDFREHHGPGNEDHADGVLARYAVGQLLRVPNVPSHLRYDPADGQLYVADTGHGRVVQLDTASGTPAGPALPNYDQIETASMDGAVLTELVPAGTLGAPSGLVVHDGLIFVTDNFTSRIHVFDKDGVEQRFLDTGFAPGSLAGLTIGPDDKAYFVEQPTGSVYRIDPL